MKKLLSTVLMLWMVIGLGVPSFASGEAGGFVGMANPWMEASPEEIEKATGLSLVIPEGVDAVCRYMPDMAQASWTATGVSVTERVSPCNEEPAMDTETLSALSGVWFTGMNTQSKELTVGGRCPGYMEFVRGTVGAIIWYDEALGVAYTLSMDPVTDPKALGDLAEIITPLDSEAGETCMIVIDGCAIAHDLRAVPTEKITDVGDFLWKVVDGYGITYTDADGMVWGICRAGAAGVFEIVVSSEQTPSPWTVGEQIWVGGSKLVELCVQDGRLTHILTDVLVSGAAYDAEIRDMASGSGEPSGEASGSGVSSGSEEAMTVEERAWWDAFEVPEGMADIKLYPDGQLALREKNYETVCRFMQGLSPYLYLLYTDDVVTGVAYDFSLTKNAMRNDDMAFQKLLDASNAEQYPDWEWKNIHVFQSDDPNVFVIECDGSGTYTVAGEAIRTHADHYLHKFTLEDGRIKEYIEFNNPVQELTEMGYRVSPAGGGGSSEEPEDEGPVNENGLTAGEQAWWDGFTVPKGMDVPLYPDNQLELREKNYEAVCRYMQGLNKYLYLLYTDDVKTGVAFDFGGTTNPFNPVMTTGITGAAAMDKANAEGYPDWEWSNYQVYQSDDPNVFLVEVDGHGGTHSDHYMHEFILRDGKIAQYIEFNSPLNEAIENGFEVPDFH